MHRNSGTSDVRISASKRLTTPGELVSAYPATEAMQQVISQSRQAIEDALLGRDLRLVCIVGPCSVHDPKALLEFAKQFKEVSTDWSDALVPVLRVYFEKPRSVIGWKGLINDPDLDGSFNIEKGLSLARQVLTEVADLGLPAATEFLDTTFGQYYADLISFGAIGARTVESQVHRELASGLSMPVGFKNATNGNTGVAIDAIRSARHPHWFPSLMHDGQPAILESTGNPHAYMILRGGSDTGPNYEATHIKSALRDLQKRDLPGSVIVDCSHGNSQKQHRNQIDVASNLAEQIGKGERGIRGIMLESHLVEGNQDINQTPLTFGQSITDACLGIDDTMKLLDELAQAVRMLAKV